MSQLQPGQKIAKDFFIYTTGRFSVAPAAQTTQNIAISADSDFEITKITYFSDLAGVAQTVNGQILPNCNVIITDTGSGRQLMNVAIAIGAMFGLAREPFILPIPKIIAARSNLQIVVTSFEAAVTPSISLNFIGNKIFTYSA